MILKLRTLTPLHVGDGSTLHPFDFTVLDGRFYRCSPQFFERFLEQLGPHAGDQFVQWSSKIMDKMVELDQSRRLDPRLGKDYNQNMSALRRAHTLQEFAKSIGQERAFVDFLRVKAPSIPNQPVGRGERPKQEYRGFQRGGDGTAFLPGSSVKGSIRTALLYHFLEEHESHAEIREILQKDIQKIEPLILAFKNKIQPIVRDYESIADEPRDYVNERKIKELQRKIQNEKKWLDRNLTQPKKEFAVALEHLAFFAGMTNEKGKPSSKEAQNDLMRCLLVADTSVPNTDMGMENIDLYLVKWQAEPDSDGGDFIGLRQTQTPAVEAIQPGISLDIRLDFNAELLLRLHRQPSDEGLRIGRETHFIGWRKRAKTLFNLTSEDFEAVPKNARPNDPAVQALRKKALDHILACCRTFSDAQAKALTKWADSFKKHASDKYMINHLDTGTDPIISATGVRLHLGFATGFEGMTVVLHLLAGHQKQFADIMEMFGIGDSPSAKRSPGKYYRAKPDRFPTSRRLATRPGAIFPLGWLEWAEDPMAGPTKTIVSHRTVVVGSGSGLPQVQTTVAPAGPVFLRGTLKQGAELDAELIEGGNPGKFKLFIREDFLPVAEIKYAAGFKTEDVGRIARLRVKNVSSKAIVVEFVRFK